MSARHPSPTRPVRLHRELREMLRRVDVTSRFVTAFDRGGDSTRFLAIAATVAQHKPGVAP